MNKRLSHPLRHILRSVGRWLAIAPLLFVGQLGAEDAYHGEHAEHHYHKNVAGVFVGITNAGRRKNAPAIGFEYAHRFTENFSVGGVAEYTGGDADIWIAAIPFGWHLGHLKLYVAPGIEDGHHGTEELVRLGAEYAFEMGEGWEVAPQVNVDFVDSEDVWVFGLVFARGF